MQTLKDRYQALPAWIKNKYTISLLIFCAWITFIESENHNVIGQFKIQKELNKIETQQAFYESETERINADRELLMKDPKSQEKFAREKYLMKKENEDVFIMEIK